MKLYVKVFRSPIRPLPLLCYEHTIPYTTLQGSTPPNRLLLHLVPLPSHAQDVVDLLILYQLVLLCQRFAQLTPAKSLRASLPQGQLEQVHFFSKLFFGSPSKSTREICLRFLVLGICLHF